MTKQTNTDNSNKKIALKDRDEALKAVWASPKLTLAEKAVYNFLALTFYFKGQRCYYYAQEDIALATYLSDRAVKYAIKKLCDKIGLLGVDRRKRHCNKYSLIMDHEIIRDYKLKCKSRLVEVQMTTTLGANDDQLRCKEIPTDNVIDRDLDNEKDKEAFFLGEDLSGAIATNNDRNDLSSASRDGVDVLSASQDRVDVLSASDMTAAPVQEDISIGDNSSSVNDTSINGFDLSVSQDGFDVSVSPNEIEPLSVNEDNSGISNEMKRNMTNRKEAVAVAANDADWKMFLRDYRKEVADKRKAQVYADSRVLFDGYLDRGVDVLAALRKFNAEIDKNKGYDYTFYPYPNKWLKDEMMKYVMEGGKRLNPNTILEHLHIFVEANTGNGRYPLSEPAEKSCSKQIQKYKDALCGQEYPIKHYKIIDDIIRMREAKGQQVLSQEEQGLMEHANALQEMMGDKAYGDQVANI